MACISIACTNSVYEILSDLHERFPHLHGSIALQLQVNTHETSSGIALTPSATVTATRVLSLSLRIQIYIFVKCNVLINSDTIFFTIV